MFIKLSIDYQSLIFSGLGWEINHIFYVSSPTGTRSHHYTDMDFFLHLEFQPQTSNWNLIFNFFFFFNNQSVLVFSTSPLLYSCWVYLGDPSDSSFFPLILHIFNSSHLSIVVPLSIFFFDYDSIQESVSVWRAYPCLSVLSFELLRLRGPIS